MTQVSKISSYLITSVFAIPWNFAFIMIQGKTYKFRCKFREINILLLGKFQGNSGKIKLKMLSEPWSKLVIIRGNYCLSQPNKRFHLPKLSQ